MGQIINQLILDLISLSLPPPPDTIRRRRNAGARIYGPSEGRLCDPEFVITQQAASPFGQQAVSRYLHVAAQSRPNTLQ
jgi:hypothetical protein